MQSYIYDDSVILERGLVDGFGRTPSGYIADLQSDLGDLGFASGRVDGIFGARTEKALRKFQQEAGMPARTANNRLINVDVQYTREVDGRAESMTRKEIDRWQRHGWSRVWSNCESPPPEMYHGVLPQQIHHIPFADPAVGEAYWPVRTDHEKGRTVSFLGNDGKYRGRAGRRFSVPRDGGRRFHVGIDIFANHHDIIVAPESGIIVEIHYFYRTTWAMIFQCESGVVINLGEIGKDSWKEFDREIGSEVSAGEPVARVGKMRYSSMCHFETYIEGWTHSKQLKDLDDPGPILDPSKYLIHLAEHGQ
ncbi:MAG TPA: hypothetical protein ENJ18_10040 [Nannocystis exedens]|nr:hypothetical protein [Nannocystis exedens]